MSQKSFVPQAAKSVSQALMSDTQYPALHASQCCLLASGFLQYAVFKPGCWGCRL